MNKIEKKQQFLYSGNEALARGAWEAGLRVAAAYPGTPSTEILENIATYTEIDAQWSVNEKVAYEVAYGAAIGGARSLYASKHVGLNVAMDPFMTSVYMGINAGFVAVVCDDPGLHSSQNEQDTRWVSIFGKAPLIEPADAAEAHWFIQEAFVLSERFDTPVLFRMTTRTAHAKQNVPVGERTEAQTRPLVRDMAKYVMVPKNAYMRHIKVEERLVALARFAETARFNQVQKGPAKLGFITSGVSHAYVRDHYPDAAILKLGMLYPLCEKKIRAFAKSVRELVVVEELDPFLETQLNALKIKFRAKHPSYRIGELRPEYIPAIVTGKKKTDAPAAVRKPSLCAGCPHHFVFHALKKFNAFIAGDIGCYTLGALPPYSALHSCICMGGGITFPEGLRRGAPGQSVIGVIGDSTFVHSGITGLINAAYNKSKGLLIIMDNAITAMTGGQEHPGTGKTLKGEDTKLLRIEDICAVCGADTVDVIDPCKHRELEELVEKRLKEGLLSVIITRHPCILKK